MSNLVVFQHNTVDVVDSRQVAEMIGKEHKNLLRDIAGYIETMAKSDKISQLKIEPSDFFIESTFENRGKQYPCYLLTKKGCDMVANKMTGEKGVLFSAAYVTAFEIMRECIDKNMMALPKDYPSALRALADQVEQNQKLIAENATMKPKAQYFDDLIDNNLLTSIRNTAKELFVPERKFTRWPIDNKFAYRDRSKNNKLFPYAQYITGSTENKYFEIKDFKKDGYLGQQVFITPRGKKVFKFLYEDEK